MKNLEVHLASMGCFLGLVRLLARRGVTCGDRTTYEDITSHLEDNATDILEDFPFLGLRESQHRARGYSWGFSRYPFSSSDRDTLTIDFSTNPERLPEVLAWIDEHLPLQP